MASCQYLWHAGVRRFGLDVVPALAVLGLAACQQPAAPGPMEPAGTAIDRTVARAQRGVAGFSQEAGRSLGRAGRTAGDAACEAGAQIHAWLEPAPPEDPPVWR